MDLLSGFTQPWDSLAFCSFGDYIWVPGGNMWYSWREEHDSSSLCCLPPRQLVREHDATMYFLLHYMAPVAAYIHTFLPSRAFSFCLKPLPPPLPLLPPLIRSSHTAMAITSGSEKLMLVNYTKPVCDQGKSNTRHFINLWTLADIDWGRKALARISVNCEDHLRYKIGQWGNYSNAGR